VPLPPCPIHPTSSALLAHDSPPPKILFGPGQARDMQRLKPQTAARSEIIKRSSTNSCPRWACVGADRRVSSEFHWLVKIGHPTEVTKLLDKWPQSDAAAAAANWLGARRTQLFVRDLLERRHKDWQTAGAAAACASYRIKTIASPPTATLKRTITSLFEGPSACLMLASLDAERTQLFNGQKQLF